MKKLLLLTALVPMLVMAQQELLTTLAKKNPSVDLLASQMSSRLLQIDVDNIGHEADTPAHFHREVKQAYNAATPDIKNKICGVYLRMAKQNENLKNFYFAKVGLTNKRGEVSLNEFRQELLADTGPHSL